MPDDRKYSGLRDLVLGKLKISEALPVEFSEKNQEVIKELNLQNIFYARLLPFSDKVYLNKRFDDFNKDGGVSLFFNDDILFISWVLMKGIVDSQGDPIFNEDDVVAFCGKFWLLVYDMAWSVCKVNDITFKDKQNTVGNSEGTEQHTLSSGPPVPSNPLLEG
jgi:hypothetical protein